MGYKKDKVEDTALENISEEHTTLWNVPCEALSDLDEAHLAGYYKAIDHGAMKKLKKQERVFWKLAYFNWLPLIDIAKREKVSVDVVKTVLKSAATKLKKLAYKYVYKKPISEDFTSQGFQKNLKTRYKTDRKKDARTTDKEFEKRLSLYEKEINEFYRLHPEEK